MVYGGFSLRETKLTIGIVDYQIGKQLSKALRNPATIEHNRAGGFLKTSGSHIVSPVFPHIHSVVIGDKAAAVEEKTTLDVHIRIERGEALGIDLKVIKVAAGRAGNTAILAKQLHSARVKLEAAKIAEALLDDYAAVGC